MGVFRVPPPSEMEASGDSSSGSPTFLDSRRHLARSSSMAFFAFFAFASSARRFCSSFFWRFLARFSWSFGTGGRELLMKLSFCKKTPKETKRVVEGTSETNKEAKRSTYHGNIALFWVHRYEPIILC